MAALTKKHALRIHETMIRIRRFEERAIELFQAGELPGFLHACIGQEAAAAGVCAHLSASAAWKHPFRSRRSRKITSSPTRTTSSPACAA
ncbi:MAG: hypothetical protein V3U53_02465 [bacterium]